MGNSVALLWSRNLFLVLVGSIRIISYFRWGRPCRINLRIFGSRTILSLLSISWILTRILLRIDCFGRWWGIVCLWVLVLWLVLLINNTIHFWLIWHVSLLLELFSNVSGFLLLVRFSSSVNLLLRLSFLIYLETLPCFSRLSIHGCRWIRVLPHKRNPIRRSRGRIGVGCSWLESAASYPSCSLGLLISRLSQMMGGSLWGSDHLASVIHRAELSLSSAELEGSLSEEIIGTLFWRDWGVGMVVDKGLLRLLSETGGRLFGLELVGVLEGDIGFGNRVVREHRVNFILLRKLYAWLIYARFLYPTISFPILLALAYHNLKLTLGTICPELSHRLFKDW